jgi:RNA polymerase sigma-70 factor, ECF subfamily
MENAMELDRRMDPSAPVLQEIGLDSAEMVEMVARRVHRLARRMTRWAEAEDVAQDALVAVLRSLPSYRGEGQFERWVDRVTQRVVFAASRRRRAERELRLAYEGEAPAASHDIEQVLAFRRALRLLDTLPYEQGRAILLHHVYGMSVPEIAAALAIPVETARSRLRLARQKTRHAR